MNALRGHRSGVNEWYTPYDDEQVTYTGTASQGLTPAKVALCKMVVMRFISGDGRLRVSGNTATASDGVPVFAGDIETMTRFEAERLSGIRGGVTNLVAWATYYS